MTTGIIIGIIALTGIYYKIFYAPKNANAILHFAYDQYPGLREFSQHLISTGFKWKSDGLNATQVTDSYANPDLVYYRRWGNCNDYCGLFQDFCKWKKGSAAQRFEEYLVTGSKGWHYVTLFFDKTEVLYQSNMHITKVISVDDVFTTLSRNGYTKSKKTKEWKA